MIFIAIFLAVGGIVWFISARSQSKHPSLDDQEYTLNQHDVHQQQKQNNRDF